jgi:hypothetical protein
VNAAALEASGAPGGVAQPPFKKFIRPIRITLAAPFASSGLEQSRPGIDTSLLRDHDDNLILSGDQVLGLLRHILDDMIEAGASGLITREDIRAWFGAEQGQIQLVRDDAFSLPDDDGRARLKVFDLKIARGDGSRTKTYSRVAVAEATGAQREGALQVIEAPFAIGEEAEFEGDVRFFGTDDEADRLMRAIMIALGFIPAMASNKSAGFGRVCSAVLESGAAPVTLAPQATAPSRPDIVELDATFDHPFVVDWEFLSGNTYRSSTVIPGSVFKAALAKTLDYAGVKPVYDDALSMMTIGHGLPRPAGGHTQGRPRRLPLSVVQVMDGTSIVAFDLLNRDLPAEGNILFWPDWKKGVQVAETRAGWTGHPALITRTHTAINRATGTPVEEQLFSMQAVVPTGHMWATRLVRNDAPSDKFDRLVRILLDGGLETIGKTSVPVTFAPRDLDSRAAKPFETIDGHDYWRIDLQTTAWMIPFDMLPHPANRDASPTLTRIYASYFEQALAMWRAESGTSDDGAALQMVEFYSQERWAGRAIAVRHPERNFYYPYLLTEPGSVFVLRGREASQTAQAFFDHLLIRGLPLLTGARDYRRCPFLRENGFGEVTVDDHACLIFREGRRLVA